MLIQNAQQAEIQQGCCFAERFDSATNTAKNSGTVTGVIKGGKLYCISGTGASFSKSNMEKFLTNGGSLRLRWRLNETGSSSRPILFYGIDANYLIKVLHKGSDGAINVELRNGAGNNYYKVTGSASAYGVVDIVVTWNAGGTTLTLFVNGVYADNDSVAGGLTFTDGTTFGALQVGFATGLTPSTDVVVEEVQVYDTTILAVFGTEGMAVDYYKNSIFNYEDKATFILPMTVECHDATNVRTLDVAGKGKHFTFGDGSTPTKYPTKLTGRGYDFDGTADYLEGSPDIATGHTSISIVMCFAPDFNYDANAVTYLFGTSAESIYAVIKQNNASSNVLDLWLGNEKIESIASAVYAPYWKVGCDNILIITAVGGSHKTNVWLNGGRILTDDTSEWLTTANIPATLTLGASYVPANYFDGKIKYFAVYPIAFTLMQVDDLNLKLRKQMNLI